MYWRTCRLLLKRGRDADWYWVHTLWTLYLILFMATLWWVQLNWGAVRHIAYFQYLSLLLMPALVMLPPNCSPPAAARRHHRTEGAFLRDQASAVPAAPAHAAQRNELDSALKGWDHLVAPVLDYRRTQLYWLVACFVRATGPTTSASRAPSSSAARYCCWSA